MTGSLNPFRLTMWQLLRVHPLDLQVPGIGALLYDLQRGGNLDEEWRLYLQLGIRNAPEISYHRSLEQYNNTY